MKGSYLLLLKLNKDTIIQVGKKREIFFSQGYYVYVGSALNGLEQRIHRHHRAQKKKFWNIDYFLDYAKIISNYVKQGNAHEECAIAYMILEDLTPVPQFGCSDCSCSSHLFYAKTYNQIIDIIHRLPVESYSVLEKS
jgi:Uri superfamily endonuclease